MFLSSGVLVVAKMRFIREKDAGSFVSAMNANDVKADFENLEVHLGPLRDSKFKAKCKVTYEEQMLIMDGGKRVARMHARNIGNVHLEKKAIRIAAMNFEVKEGEDVSVVSGSIRLELGDAAKDWYEELWG
ncbi:MAG: hypothetical protein ACFFDV_01245 [Candidatus Thorarchaeota archaeon]